jgi:hypothetical protein
MYQYRRNLLHFLNLVHFVKAIIVLFRAKANATMEDDEYDDDRNENNDNDMLTTLETSTLTHTGGIINSVGSVFDDEMVEKIMDNGGKPRWRCKWCDNDFAGWNATKAIAHLNKLRKSDIKPCKVRIDSDYAKKYLAMLKETERKRRGSRQSHGAIDRSISSHNNITASTLESRRSNSSTISSKRSKLSLESDDNNGTCI